MFPAVLLGAFGVWFVAWGIAARFREDWLLENVLVFAAVPALVWAYPRLRFSNRAYLLLFVFFFPSARLLHRVAPVAGPRARITLGGFLALDRDRERVLYWS